MLKVIYVYLTLIFGAALIAVIYLRAEDRGWPSTITFISVLVTVTVFQWWRARNRRSANADGASDDRNG